MNHTMTWADFYLICFAVGFCLSFFSFVFGGARTGRLRAAGVGRGAPQDGPKAVELLRAAARQGMTASMFTLGDIYDRGDGGLWLWRIRR